MIDDLWLDADEILSAVAAELTEPPTRVYVADGRPAFDECEQLTLHLAGFHVGTPDQERPSRPCAPTTVTAVVTRTWCVPVGEDGNPPRHSELVASGRTVVVGAHELFRAVDRAARVVACRPAVIDSRPVEPSGGYVGWTVTISWIPTTRSTQ